MYEFKVEIFKMIFMIFIFIDLKKKFRLFYVFIYLFGGGGGNLKGLNFKFCNKIICN